MVLNSWEMSDQALHRWTTFFSEAGVPRGPAKEYATLFCNHRIKENLLGDLTKDILNDIGINVMGDIMSILKHAKAVHAKLEREKLSNRLAPDYDETDDTPASEESEVQTVASQPNRKSPVNPALIKSKPSDVRPTGVVTNVSKTTASTAGNGIKKGLVKTVDNSETGSRKRPMKMTMSLSERFASGKPPKSFKEASKLPAKTIQTTKRELNDKSKAVPVKDTDKLELPKRKSAFERLGKELSVPKKQEDMLIPKVKMTKLVKSPENTSTSPASVNKAGISVFKRLGETETQVSSGRKTTSITIRTTPSGLGSRVVSGGIEKRTKLSGVLPALKPMHAVKPVKTVSPINSTRKRTSATTPEQKSSPQKAEKSSVFSRLGSPAD